MTVRRKALVAAPVLVCGAAMAWAGPAAADETWARTDTFRDCEVVSQLTVRDSGTIEVSTALEGEEVPCDFESVSARVTYVDDDGDPRSATVSGPASVRYSFSAPGATDVRSFHSTDFWNSCSTISGDVCDSPEYELRAK